MNKDLEIKKLKLQLQKQVEDFGELLMENVRLEKCLNITYGMLEELYREIDPNINIDDIPGNPILAILAGEKDDEILSEITPRKLSNTESIEIIEQDIKRRQN